jgi:hypothetical protein
MERDFATNLTGAAFLAAALMLWGGWMLLPRRIGAFFRPDDFAAIGARLQFWLWMYRVHLFGVVVTALALVALAALPAERSVQVLVAPGAAVAVAGLIVGAAGSAFYYHFGVWGTIELTAKPPDAVRGFVDSLRLTTEYVTCLVRFGRVFSGLGLLVLAVGLLRWGFLPPWVGWGAAVIGVASMALTMLLPDNWSVYTPVFHLLSLWMAATGVVILWSGIGTGT